MASSSPMHMPGLDVRITRILDRAEMRFTQRLSAKMVCVFFSLVKPSVSQLTSVLKIVSLFSIIMGLAQSTGHNDLQKNLTIYLMLYRQKYIWCWSVLQNPQTRKMDKST